MSWREVILFASIQFFKDLYCWHWNRGVDPIILSVHKSVSFPFPRLIEMWFLTWWMTFLMSFHAWVHGLFEIKSVRIFECCLLRYFFKRASTHQLPFSINIRQTSLKPMALFVTLGILMEMPHFSKGRVTYFQRTKLNFFVSCFPPCQRNPLMINSICLWMLVGANIIAYWWIGRADRRAFIRIVLPARFNHIIPQLWSFPLIFSIYLFYVSDLTPSFATGKPR